MNSDFTKTVIKVYHPNGDLEGCMSKVFKDLKVEKHKHREEEKQRMDQTLAWMNKELKKNQPAFNVNIMKKRREAKNARKDSKNVKTAGVSQGEVEDYDIERVLQDLEVGEDKSGPKKCKNAKKSKKKQKKKENGACSIDEQFDELQIAEAKCSEVLDTTTKTDVSEVKSQPTQRPTNSTEGDCSICFCPKTRTFAFIPCFHATFCQDCAERIFKDTRRCPTCQVPIENKTRIFL